MNKETIDIIDAQEEMENRGAKYWFWQTHKWLFVGYTILFIAWLMFVIGLIIVL